MIQVTDIPGSFTQIWDACAADEACNAAYPDPEGTLTEVIADLDSQFPGIADRLIEDGGLRRFVNVYVNDEDVRFLGSLDVALKDGDAVTILPAVAGGSH